MEDEKVSLRPPVIEQFRWSLMRVGAVLLSLLLPAMHGYADDDSWAMLSHDARRVQKLNRSMNSWLKQGYIHIDR
jgi:hypothetical protein